MNRLYIYAAALIAALAWLIVDHNRWANEPITGVRQVIPCYVGGSSFAKEIEFQRRWAKKGVDKARRRVYDVVQRAVRDDAYRARAEGWVECPGE